MELVRGRRRSDRRGFTVIELLIVIVIMGILAAIAMPQFGESKGQAVGASVKSDLRNAVTSLEAYSIRNAGAAQFTYTGATPANVNVQLSPGNVLTLPSVAPTTVQLVVTNTNANISCTQTIGQSPVPMSCTGL
jgi:prepilin-type N-terminal cleavage/methylation domain-containing protein